MFNIMKNAPKWILASIIVMVAGIVALVAFGGFKTDIDFSGGTMMQLNMEKDFNLDELKTVVKGVIGVDADMVQKASDTTAQYQAIIKMRTLGPDERTSLYNAIKEKFQLTNTYETSLLSCDNITPLVSSEIIYNAALAVVIASLLILLYVTIRFTFSSGVAAILSLVHDVLIMFAVYALLKLPLNSSFIAAVLTVIGYSINDTIVVFDRIRENKKFARHQSFGEICEKSIWQTMRRSLNTTGTTVVTLIVLAIMGESSIRAFVIPLIIGIISGAYSSIFIAAPSWNWLEGSSTKKSGKPTKKPA